VVINGQTGRIAGKVPLAWWKITLALVLVLAVVAVILYLAQGARRDRVYAVPDLAGGGRPAVRGLRPAGGWGRHIDRARHARGDPAVHRLQRGGRVRSGEARPALRVLRRDDDDRASRRSRRGRGSPDPVRGQPRPRGGVAAGWLGKRGYFAPAALHEEAVLESLTPICWAGWSVTAHATVAWTADSDQGALRSRGRRTRASCRSGSTGSSSPRRASRSRGVPPVDPVLRSRRGHRGRRRSTR